MIAEPTGTDGSWIIRKKTSVTGRHDQPLFLPHACCYSCFSLFIQERIFQVASTGVWLRIARGAWISFILFELLMIPFTLLTTGGQGLTICPFLVSCTVTPATTQIKSAYLVILAISTDGKKSRREKFIC